MPVSPHSEGYADASQAAQSPSSSSYSSSSSSSSSSRRRPGSTSYCSVSYSYAQLSPTTLHTLFPSSIIHASCSQTYSNNVQLPLQNTCYGNQRDFIYYRLPGLFSEVLPCWSLGDASELDGECHDEFREPTSQSCSACTWNAGTARWMAWDERMRCLAMDLLSHVRERKFRVVHRVSRRVDVVIGIFKGTFDPGHQ